MAWILTLAAPIATIGVLVAFSGSRSGQNLERTALRQLASQVSRHAGAVQVALDSTDMQVRGGLHVIGWMEGIEPGGSAQMLAELAQMRRRPEIHSAAPDTDRLRQWAAARADPSMIRLVASYETLLAQVDDVGGAAVEQYVGQLERRLPPELWRHLFEIDLEPRPIDFRKALYDLSQTDFDRDIRPGVRGLIEYSGHLEALRAVADSLILEMDEHTGDP